MPIQTETNRNTTHTIPMTPLGDQMTKLRKYLKTTKQKKTPNGFHAGNVHIVSEGTRISKVYQVIDTIS